METVESGPPGDGLQELLEDGPLMGVLVILRSLTSKGDFNEVTPPTGFPPPVLLFPVVGDNAVIGAVVAE